MNIKSLNKSDRGISLISFALLILAAQFFTACNNPAKKNEAVDSTIAESISLVADTVTTATDPVPPKVFNSFRVKSHEVKIPHLSDFAPLISLIQNSNTIKKIAFYTPTPSTGLADMVDNAEPFLRAKNISAAKKYSNCIAQYDFDKNGNVIEVDNDTCEEYEFSYDADGHPTRISYITEGYRGSPSYTAKYDISWDGDTPLSMKRRIINYESAYDDVMDPNEAVPFEYDFKGDFPAMIIKTIKKNKPSVIGNSCKIPASGSNEFPIWCEIEYYN
ncbi:MAG: hypothetical protein K2N05_02195 [Muribaculaceae bacterium]|nr:hypothetical protein [Muribaculaceae bacterium]